MQKLMKKCGITEGHLENEEPQDSMFFELNANESAEEKEDCQMWFSESSRLMDWLYQDEDMQCH